MTPIQQAAQRNRINMMFATAEPSFGIPRMVDIGKGQLTFNLIYRVSDAIYDKQDMTSSFIKQAIAGSMPFAKILKEVAEQCADERSRPVMNGLLGTELVNDIVKWYQL